MWQDRAYASPAFGSIFSRAPATWWLIGITTAAHVARVLLRSFLPGWEVAIWTHGPTTLDGWRSFELWRPVTYLFIHGNTQHILWNMIFLGFAGTMLEPRIGSRALVRIYVVSGLVGALSPVLHSQSPIGTIGASGAINGVLVALAVLMPDIMVLFLFLIPMKIKWVVAIFLGIDLLNVLGRDGGGTDSICHLLGAACGFTVAFVVPRVLSPWLARRRDERTRRQERAEIEQSLDEDRELDRLLEKISRDGMHQLTESERRFLKRVSGKYQNARRD